MLRERVEIRIQKDMLRDPKLKAKLHKNSEGNCAPFVGQS